MAAATKRRAIADSRAKDPPAAVTAPPCKEEVEDDSPAFVDASPDGSAGDSSDSESSVYSGLEEEESASSNGSASDGDDTADDHQDMKIAAAGKLRTTRPNFSWSGQGPSVEIDEAKHAGNEYEFDSSDEEDIRNTVGNIPMEWYREYAHLGYDLAGEKILKPKSADELDKFLEKMDNPDYFKTVRDKQTGQDVVLTDADVDAITRIQGRHYPDGSYNPYEDWTEFFTRDVMIHPLSNRPEHKRSFIPSKWERLKVGRLVHALKMGWIKPRPPPKRIDDETPHDPSVTQAPRYDLWSQDDTAESDIVGRLRQRIPAPKLQLPGHSESYNPPPEYLLTPEEEAAWKDAEPEERRQNFVPRTFSSLRLVPSYSRFVNERFERCLDLYLCPRQQKMKMNVNPEDLIPKLPKPKDLQPFPTTESIVYKGHEGYVRCVAVDPTGQWMATGSEDKTIKFWEVQTGRCRRTCAVGEPIKSLCWNPNAAFSLIAAAVGDAVLLINSRLGDKLVCSNTDHLIDKEPDDEGAEDITRKLMVKWSSYSNESAKIDGLLLKIMHAKPIGQVTWHSKGDYFAAVIPQGEKQSVIIHQLSKRRSQNPFTKPKGLVQCVLFHPIKPYFFVATQKYVRVYNLQKQELTKKLVANCKWISSMAIHPSGDNVIIGSYDCRLNWFDMDLSTKPYQTLKHQKRALRSVSFHRKYPLFASSSDDGTVVISHGMVYNDLMQNPLIVPVKILKGHAIVDGLGVLDCVFHPTQPWIFTGGADGTARLFT